MGNTANKNIHDTYHLQKVKLGEGSFGIVWRGVHRRSGEVAAVKQLNKAGMPARGVRRADVEREIRMVASLLHENVIRLYQVFEDERSIYMALEYCEGGDFGDKVLERGCNIDQLEMARWMLQLLSAIAFLHANGICHRDIKPDNFLVAHRPEEGPKLKLADMGLAAHCPVGIVLTEKCGTPAYMAPEQHLLPVRSRGYGLPVDVWAAGLCMYMLMFGGRHPFLNGNRGLNERALLEGTLDFSTNSLLGALGVGGLRMSDEARFLCQAMVNVRASPRLSAAQAVERVVQLLQGGGGRGQPPAAGAAPPPQGGPPGSPQPGPPRPGARPRSLSRTPKEGRGSTQALKDAVARVAKLPGALANRTLGVGGA